MAVNIEFYAGTNQFNNLTGSGLGFFGSTFGQSVNVGQYQDSTFITNSNGTIQGPQANNIKHVHPASGSINSLTAVNLLAIPNYLATLNIRLVSDTPVRTQNAKFRVFDRVNINNNPSGVLCKVAQIIKPDPNQASVNGSGSSSWQTIQGSGTILNLTPSPGFSGLSPNGASTESTRHDFYLALSANPSSVGSKTFAGYVEIEYL